MALLFWCCVCLAVTLNNALVQAIDGTQTTTALRCLNKDSAKCTINRIESGNSNIEFPNLQDKTTLQIKGGNMPTFALCDRLKTVERLQLGTLQLKELCLTWMLREVSAASNNISTIKFTPSDYKSEYKLEYLDLHNNALTSLDGFDVLVNLVEVHLEHNALESFSWAVFKHMDKLEKLYLKGNKIKNVVADNEIKLPVLEYLSLAGNQLSNLDVLNWKFESLTEYDFSSNNLHRVDNLTERFPSSQAVLLANNQWYCSWLEDTLEQFDKLFVAIKDRDETCEGITAANICCIPESYTFAEDTVLENKLTELEKAQEALKSELKTKLANLKTNNENDLNDLIRLYDTLPHQALVSPPASSSSELVTSNKNSQYLCFEETLGNLNSTVGMELKDITTQLFENERAQLRLSYTMLELKRSIERGRKTTAGLQAQLDNLRTDIYKKQKKHN